ncbi:acetyltransferase [bacterium]|nr:acetyltransferase [bacterium]
MRSTPPSPRTVAEEVHRACVETTFTAYETARMDGLCHEGAWEIAVNALRQLDLGAILHKTSDTARKINQK